MAFRILRRTLVSISSNLTNISQFPFSPNLYFLSTISAKPVADYLINEHQLSPEAASSAASAISHMKSFKKPDLILDYLKQTGLSKTQLDDLLVFDPRLLIFNLDKSIKPKVEAIKNLGFSSYDLCNLLCSVPAILTIQRAPARLVSSVSVLKSMLESNVEVIKLLMVCDWFLASDLDKTMSPNIELLKKCGVCLSQIRQLVFNFPRFFLHRTEFLRDCVKRVDEMGLSRGSKMYIHGIRAVSSMSQEKWDSKLRLLSSLGFSDGDILSVFRRTPQIFAISEKKIKEVTELLLSSGNVDISFVVLHPELLIYSAQRRIKPRMQIIRVLVSKDLLSKEPSLTTVCKMDDECFLRRFVIPYAPEIGEVGEKFMLSKRGLIIKN